MKTVMSVKINAERCLSGIGEVRVMAYRVTGDRGASGLGGDIKHVLAEARVNISTSIYKHTHIWIAYHMKLWLHKQ